MNAFLVDKIIGSKVMNLQGETLGKIADLVVDAPYGTSSCTRSWTSGGFWRF